MRVLLAWLASCCIGAGLVVLFVACGEVDRKAVVPLVDVKPRNVVTEYSLARGLDVVEFRDSAGRICVATVVNGSNERASALDCGYPVEPKQGPE